MDTDVLAQLINAKLELLSQLRQLAVRQAELIEAADMSRILSLLAVKQRLLNTVDDIERRLDPFRQQDPEQRVWQSPEHRQRARDASARCDVLLQEVIAIERQGETYLTRRRDQAADQLQGVHRSLQVAKAYLATPDHSGQQFDASCET